MVAYRDNLIKCFEMHNEAELPEAYKMLKNKKGEVKESGTVNTMLQEHEDTPEDILQTLEQGIARVLFGQRDSRNSDNDSDEDEEDNDEEVVSRRNRKSERTPLLA